MDDFSDNLDVEILSQLPEEDIPNTVVDSEEGFENVLAELQAEAKAQEMEKETLLSDM